jgi:hypothetical protein
MEWTSCKEVFEISWEVNSICGGYKIYLRTPYMEIVKLMESTPCVEAGSL